MTAKRFLSATLGAFVFVFLYELLVHGQLMMGLYNQTASLWRPQEECNMAIMLLSQLLFAAALAFFYPIIGSDTECKKAIPFGAGLGLDGRAATGNLLLFAYTTLDQPVVGADLIY